MFDKYLVPLYMLYCMNGEVRGRTRFQKLVFLTKQNLKEEDKDIKIQFSKLFYGPFSRDLMESLNGLKKEGLIDEEVEEGSYGLVYIYKLTSNGTDLVKDSLQKRLIAKQAKKIIQDVADEFGHTPLDELISFVYSKYPDYNPHLH